MFAVKMHTRSEIDEFIKLHEDRYGWYDGAITSLIRAFPTNDTYNPVINKVVVINRLYSTNILDVDGMARKIVDLHFDSRIHEADLTLVHDVASPNVKYTKNQYYNYSFATKYCNWHEQTSYPIFDSVVKSVVSKYNREYRFSDVKVKEYLTYPLWKKIIDEITEFLKIPEYRYKMADKYLWALGNQ